MRFVDIRFGDEFVRSVHTKYGYAQIDGVDVIVREELSDRSAAAEVYSAEFARLPNYAVFFEDTAKESDEFRGSVVRTALTSRAGKLVHRYAVIRVRSVVLLERVGERGVERCGNVCGKASRFTANVRAA